MDAEVDGWMDRWTEERTECGIKGISPGKLRPFTYLRSFLDDKQNFFPVLCSSSTHTSIGCRKSFHLWCTQDLDTRDSLRNKHSEIHRH